MKYTDQDRALRFASEDELQRFHADLTELVREATVSATRGVPVEEATVRARDVLRRYATVVRALNALRRSLPHSPGDVNCS
ncbi:MAG: hypothetical protein HY909_06245 [Deltaproteobacteria bacterium]|nr:hypothetical protein [Deltaproteobacteria bacterium]